MEPTAAVFRRSHRLAVLGLCGLGIVLRAPRLALEPRLWAEELTVHLAHAYSHGALQSLLLVPTSTGPAGYLQIPANLAAVLSAHLVPLEWAATVAFVVAFLCQLAPFVLVLFGRSLLWSSPAQRLLVCALVLFAPSVLPEVWLSTINSQIFCGLLAFLLLFEDLESQSPRRRRMDHGALLFCGASGVYTSLLTLPYALRAAFESRPEARREALTRALLVAVIALFQGTVYAFTVLRISLAPDRLGGVSERAAEILFFRQILQPVLGHGLVDRLEEGFAAAVPNPIVANLICGGLMVLVVLLLSRKSPKPRSLHSLFPITFTSLALTTAALALGLPGGRYAVLPGLVLLLWCSVLAIGEKGTRSWICRGVLGVAVLTGVMTFQQDQILYHRGEPTGFFGTLEEGRNSWPDQVVQFRRDPHHVLRIWPYKASDSWRAHLVHRRIFEHLRDRLDTFDEIHLTAGTEPVESRLPMPELPVEFRLVVRGSSTASSRDAPSVVLLEDASGQELLRHPLRFSAQETFTRHLPVSLREAGRIPGTPPYTLVLRVESRRGETVTVNLNDARLAPRIQGLFDTTLPSRALPTALYTSSSNAPLRSEVTSLLALESLAQDGDLLWSTTDAERTAEHWRSLPEGLRLIPVLQGSHHAYDTPLPYLLAALPFAGLGGFSAVVAAQLALLLAMAWSLHRRGRGEEPETRTASSLFSAASLFACAGLGFAFVPAPQVFEAACLFFPLQWWIHGEFKGRQAAAGGLLLGLATAQNLLWAPFAFLPLLTLLRQQRPPMGWFGGLALALVLHLLASSLLSPASTHPEDTEPAPPPRITAESPQPPTLARTLEAIQSFYTTPGGLLLGYPFLILGLLLWLRRPEASSERLAMGALLLALLALLALDGRGTELGDPRLAVLAPLVPLLPQRTPSRWALGLATAVALVFSLGVAAIPWNRPTGPFLP